jgi:hypothetical protein
MIGADHFILEYAENYQKQSYRNRSRILTAQGPLELYIPVLKPGGKVVMKDVEIDYGQKWVKDHWRSISTAYGKAPFFEHFASYFHDVYHRRPRFLVDLNLHFITLCNKLLNLQTILSKTDHFKDSHPQVDIDSRNLIHPKRHLKTSTFYKPCNYNQIFGKKFVGNLSIIDLLFCEGPEAVEILINSKA